MILSLSRGKIEVEFNRCECVNIGELLIYKVSEMIEMISFVSDKKEMGESKFICCKMEWGIDWI
jgi:hypothetical protein